MSLSPQLKEFLSRQYILNMIDNNQWNEFYNTLADFDWNNISDVTDFLVHTCDIDPLPFADDDILEFIIPDHIKFIDYSAFRNCRRLSKVVIPTVPLFIATYISEFTQVFSPSKVVAGIMVAPFISSL